MKIHLPCLALTHGFPGPQLGNGKLGFQVEGPIPDPEGDSSTERLKMGTFRAIL